MASSSQSAGPKLLASSTSNPPAPIGSERALSRSLLNNSSSSTASSFGENLENLVPAIPSYARTEFRQCNDSILSTSPTSEAYDVSAEEDSPMLVEGSSLAAAGGRLAPADILSDVEEYSLDIVAHMRKVEVKIKLTQLNKIFKTLPGFGVIFF